MKLMKRTGIYQTSNSTFDPKTKQAHSYAWWLMLTPSKVGLIFNSFNYSATTVKHQYKLRALLNDLNIKIDLEIEAPKGLQDLEAARVHNVECVAREVVKAKYSRDKDQSQVEKYMRALHNLRLLGYKTQKGEIDTEVEKAEQSRRSTLDMKKAKKVVAIPQVLA